MLTKKNARIIRKMRRYMKTFPLTELEITQMMEDIKGMAEEAQERGEDFEVVLGKPPREFCEDLIYSVGGIRAPGGRKLLRGTGIYFQLLGIVGAMGALTSVIGAAGERMKMIALLVIFVAVWYMGYYGETNCNNTQKASQLFAAGIVYLLVNVVSCIPEVVFAIDKGTLFLKTSDFPIFVLGILVNYIPGILFLIGARRNRPIREKATI